MIDRELALIARLREAISLTDPPLHTYEPEEARSVLKVAKFSAESVSKVLGCSTYSVSGWLRGDHEPGLTYADKYQTLLLLLDRANGVRANRIAQGVENLLREVRRAAEAPQEVAA